ncbi:MAG TPA: VWA domain-containing protein [Dehalococcoidia bacterium]|nr:VWA domain-containing protein [Dehalococcoidia bacterium]
MSEPLAADLAAERLRRWRLILGGVADGTGCSLGQRDAAIDRALAALYDGRPKGSSDGGEAEERGADLSGSAPRVARWLGDIREYFPASVVRVLQQDALERLNLRRMLLEPELLDAVEPDVRLVANLIALRAVMPERTKETARLVVRRVVDELERRLANPLRQAVLGSLDRAARTSRPRHNAIDWERTIRANLKHYQAEYRTLIPERLVGFGHRRRGLRDVVVCLDQSGSMATSVVYAALFGAVLASLPAINTRLVAFDTSVADLSADLEDPVDVLFGVQIGGGTDIDRALAYCQTLIERPQETILVLISDLLEGGNREHLLRRAAALAASGVTLVALLALSDEGRPVYDHAVAARFAALGAPAFACTPDLFPELMAAAIQRQEIGRWASAHGIETPRAESDI